MCVCVCMRPRMCTYSCARMCGNAYWDYHLSLCWSHPCQGIQQRHKKGGTEKLCQPWLHELAYFPLYCLSFLHHRAHSHPRQSRKKKMIFHARKDCWHPIWVFVGFLNKPGSSSDMGICERLKCLKVCHTNKPFIRLHDLNAVEKLSNYTSK